MKRYYTDLLKKDRVLTYVGKAGYSNFGGELDTIEHWEDENGYLLCIPMRFWSKVTYTDRI